MSHARSVLARILFLSVPLILTQGAAAQDSIRVTLFRPPPNQLKVADLWRIRIENRTPNTHTVYLFGRADEARDGQIVDATSSKFTLPPGVKIVNGVEIQPIDANYYNDRYKEVFLRTGQAPTGDYRVCVTVRNARNDADLATDCFDQRVEVSTPPILVMPTNESVVEEKIPAFTWLPPTPIARGSRPTYLLRLVEILGRQTPYDAMASNPAWFERASIPNTVVQYPIASRSLRVGGRYAWQVTASDKGFPLGESEIWWFTYKPVSITNVDTSSRFRRGSIGAGVDIGGGSGSDSSEHAYTFRNRGLQVLDLDGVGDDDIPRVFYRIPAGDLVANPTFDPKIPPSVLDALLTPCLGGERGVIFRTAP